MTEVEKLIVPLLVKAMKTYKYAFQVDCHGTEEQVQALCELGVFRGLDAAFKRIRTEEQRNLDNIVDAYCTEADGCVACDIRVHLRRARSGKKGEA